MVAEISIFKLDVGMYEGYYALEVSDDATERFHHIKPPLRKGSYGEVWKIEEITGAKRVRGKGEGWRGIGNKVGEKRSR